MRSKVLQLFAFVSLATCSSMVTAAGLSRQVRTALALTPEHFRNTASLKDDDLDTAAAISTEPGFTAKEGLLGVVWNDNFLRAVIDKKTGETHVVVYEFITYAGDWRHYDQVNYETPNGPQSEELDKLSEQVLSCAGAEIFGGCRQREDFIWKVDEELLRKVAAAYRPGQAAAWRFKYLGRTANDFQSGMLGAEVAGFLQALDDYRSAHHLPAPGHAR